MITIWGRANSTNVRKVLWCAEELALDYRRIDAGGAFGVVGTPEYRALNPNGLVPCLQDDDIVLWESNAIVRYLARAHGQAPFAPQDAAAWAEADKWMDWASFSFAVPFRDMFWNLVRMTPETRDEAAIERGREACAQLFARADEALSGQAYLAGNALTVGDIPLGCMAYAWFSLPITRPDLPHLEAWYRRLEARPAFRKGVMTPLT